MSAQPTQIPNGRPDVPDTGWKLEALAAARIGCWEVDLLTGIVHVDATASVLLGSDVSVPVVWSEWLSRVHPRERQRVVEEYRSILHSNATGPHEIEFELTGQPQRFVRVCGSVANGSNGVPACLGGIVMAVAKPSEEFFRRIVENAHDGVWMVDRQGKTLYANPRIAEMLRCDLDSLIGRPALDFVPAGELPRAEEETLRRHASNEGQELEFRYSRADGEDLWARVHSSMVQSAPGEPGHILGLFSDITAEKAAEATRENLVLQLNRERELLKRIIDTMPVMLTIYDPSLTQLTLNREFTKLLGWTSEDSRTTDIFTALYPDPVERKRAIDFMSSLTPGWMDFTVYSKSGEPVLSSWANFSLSDRRMVGIGIDIRESRAAELRLKESEARLKLAIDSIDLGTFDYDINARTVEWSERTRAIFGLLPDEPVDFNTIWTVVHPDDAAAVRAAAEEATRNLAGRYSLEHRVIRRTDGEHRWVAVYGRILFTSDGKAIRYTGVNFDITDRKRAEASLAEARARQEIVTSVVSRLLTEQDPQSIIDDLARQVMAKTGAEIYLNYFLQPFAQHDGKTDLRLRLNSSQGVSPEVLSVAEWLELGDSVCGTVAKEGVSRSFCGILDSTDKMTALLRLEGIKSYCCYPLSGSKGVLGTLGFGSRTREGFDAEELLFIQTVADHIAIAIERMRGREALQLSEERYRAIARHIPNGGVWVVDRDFRFVAMEGPLAARMGAYGLEGRIFDPASEEPGIRMAGENFLKALAGEATAKEAAFRGMALWVHYVPLRNERGEVTAAMALAFDITERKLAEDLLRESEKRERLRAVELEGVMDAVPAATWVARDPECREVYANRLGHEVLRTDPGANISMLTLDSRVPRGFHVRREGRDIDMEELPLTVAARTGKAVRDSEIEIVYDDGTSRFLFGSAVPLPGPDGSPAGAVGAFIDMTDRRKVEDQLRQAAKMESIGVLAGGVAHDFNNLLTGVLGNASLAQLDAPPRIAEKLERIVEAAEKAAGLTRQLLAYAGKGQFLFSDVDLSRVIRSSSDLIRLSVTRNVELNLSGVPSRLPLVRADSAQLQQIIMNLVINAAEAVGPSHVGSVTLTAGTRTEDTAKEDGVLAPVTYVFFRVIDTGCGMDPDVREKMFDPFFTTKFTGRGLGLAAVQGAVRALKGHIEVESQKGFGTSFTVYLPCLDQSGPPAENILPPRPMSGKLSTILVVDDETMVREIAQISLQRFGHRILLASNGQEALKVIEREGSVQLVLLDVIMPLMGGMDALHEIQSRWPHINVLLTSGFNREEARRMGALPQDIPFIQKPYTVQQLAAAVDAALAQ